ncbi:MAG: AMP-binding protein [Deltaproteobacteria bacterium]|nr:AMP-binding protein [Deltaproteobacteria bacterium]
MTVSGPDALELLSQNRLAESVDPPLLARQLVRVARESAFYQEKYALAGLSLEDAERIESFHLLPFTEKRELLADQEEHPPYGRLANRSLRRVHSTSGSTGRPLYIALTEADVRATHEAGGRAFRCAGLTSEDSVVHCLNYCLWAGGVTDHLSLEAAGALVIPFGVGHTRTLIETILALRPTTISCTPSYMSRLEVVLQQEFGLEPRKLGLRKALFGGEGGLQDPAVRGRIEERWGLRAIDANYGMADVLSIFGAECEAREGLHFHGQGILHVELLDPDTLAPVPMEGGSRGELVLTNLVREAQPLIRFRTNDVVEVTGTDPCRCGRGSFRFRVVGRSDEMVTVRGINVYPGAVANLLSREPSRFSGEFQIVLDSPPPFERPLLRIEAATDVDPSLADYVEALCRDRLSFSPRVEVLAFGAFPRTEGKTRRVRKSYLERS